MTVEPLPEGYACRCTEDPAVQDRCPNSAVSDGVIACTTHLPAALGITYRQLDHWAIYGYLHPQIYGGGGAARLGAGARGGIDPAALGITYRQLDHWAIYGYLHPQIYGGSGTARWWPAAEVEIARRMGRLAAAGLTVKRAAAFARGDWPRAEIAPGITLEATP